MLRKCLMSVMLIVCSIAPLRAMMVQQYRDELRKRIETEKFNQEQHKDITLLFRKHKDFNGTVTEYVLLRDLITLGWPYHEAKYGEYTGYLSLPAKAYENTTIIPSNGAWGDVILECKDSYIWSHFRKCFIKSFAKKKVIQDLPKVMQGSDDSEGVRVYIPDLDVLYKLGGTTLRISKSEKFQKISFKHNKTLYRKCDTFLYCDTQHHVFYAFDKEEEIIKGVWGFNFDYHKAVERFQQLRNPWEVLVVIDAINKKQNRKKNIFYNDICGQAKSIYRKMIMPLEEEPNDNTALKENSFVAYMNDHKDLIQHCVAALDATQPFTLQAIKDCGDHVRVSPKYKSEAVACLLPLVVACHTHGLLTREQTATIQKIQALDPTELSEYKRNTDIWGAENNGYQYPTPLDIESAKASKLNNNFWPIDVRKRTYIVTVIKEGAYEPHKKSDLKNSIHLCFLRLVDAELRTRLLEMVEEPHCYPTCINHFAYPFNDDYIECLNYSHWERP